MPKSFSSFKQLLLSPSELNEKLGPLSGLVGKWEGAKGFNAVAVPAPESKPMDYGAFTLLLHKYKETITFTPIGGAVRNRGGIVDQFVFGLLYELTVTDLKTDNVIHVENGQWLNLSNVTGEEGEPPFPIARTANIPHGDTALILGSYSTTCGAPTIPCVSVVPDAGPETPLGYTDKYLEPQETFDANDVNRALRETISTQDIVETVSILLSSKNDGGVLNIPFITKFANATKFEATFWLETVKAEDGSTFQQLQYSQITDLEFHKKFSNSGLIVWPHSNINTLVKA